MTYEEKTKYWNPVRDKFFNPDSYDVNFLNGRHWAASKDLEEFLGSTEWYEYHAHAGEAKTRMSDELKQKLLLLAGPYGDVIFKAMKLKREHDPVS